MLIIHSKLDYLSHVYSHNTDLYSTLAEDS